MLHDSKAPAHDRRFLREVGEVRGERVGWPGRGRQVLLEHFPGRAVAEATPGRVVEPVGQPAEAGARERLGWAPARQEAPGAAVQVLETLPFCQGECGSQK